MGYAIPGGSTVTAMNVATAEPRQRSLAHRLPEDPFRVPGPKPISRLFCISDWTVRGLRRTFPADATAARRHRHVPVHGY